MMKTKTKPPAPTADLLDSLQSEWAQECPHFDTSAMGVVGRIMRLAGNYEAQAEAAVKPHGLRYTEFDILATLRRSGAPYTMNPSRLCDAILLTSGAMTAALDRLERLKLITRQNDPADRRIRSAVLTPEGIKVAESAAKARFEIAGQSVSHMSQTEMDTLQRLLKKLSVLEDK